MERLQNQMITVNWSRKVRQLNTNDKNNRNNEDGSADVGSVDDIINKELEIGDYAIQQKTQSKEKVVIDKCFLLRYITRMRIKHQIVKEHVRFMSLKEEGEKLNSLIIVLIIK